MAELAPDWTCDPTRVRLARLYAVAVAPWARPVVRALTRQFGRLAAVMDRAGVTLGRWFEQLYR